MVEQKYKNVMLDVRKRKGVAEARTRERRMEEERRVLETNGSRGSNGVDLNGGGGGVGGGDLSEEGVRWQMQIQEDVSIIVHSLLQYYIYQQSFSPNNISINQTNNTANQRRNHA